MWATTNGGRPSTGRPLKFVFRSPYLSPSAPLPVHDVRNAIHLGFWTFLTRYTICTSVDNESRRGGVCAFQTDDVGQWEGGSKSQFFVGRFWWMYQKSSLLWCLPLCRHHNRLLEYAKPTNSVWLFYLRAKLTLKAIHDRRPVERGEGVWINVDNRGWGSAMHRMFTIANNLAFRSQYWNPTPPTPLVHERPDHNIFFCVSGDMCDTIPDVREWGGKGVLRTDDVGQRQPV